MLLTSYFNSAINILGYRLILLSDLHQFQSKEPFWWTSKQELKRWNEGECSCEVLLRVKREIFLNFKKDAGMKVSITLKDLAIRKSR